jgi:hypothetical protein
MINILNHNTSYKHSKFTARPANVVTGLAYFDKQSKALFESQSKELLCWRFDLTFFNLQGFFFSMLKALHTCWNFAKNNKNIVFVSADSPSDTGVCAMTDMLTQRFTREFLPRVQIVHTAVKAPRNKSSTNNHQLRADAPKKESFSGPFAHRSALSEQTGGGRRACAPAVSRRPLPAGKDRGASSPDASQRKQKLMHVPLSELKNLINISGVFKRQLKDDSRFDKYFVTRFVVKYDGLLYKAAARRLSASFSRTHASFFSNTKNSFREKFTHLNCAFPKPANPAQDCTRSQKLYRFDLNKSCLVKTHGLQLDALGQKARAKKARVNAYEPIFSYTSENRFDNKLKKGFDKRHRKDDAKKSMDCQKSFRYCLIPNVPAAPSIGVKLPEKAGPLSGAAIPGAKLPAKAGKGHRETRKTGHAYAFCNQHRALSDLMDDRRTSSPKRHRQNRFKGHRQNSQNKPLKSGIHPYVERYVRRSYRTYDVHGMRIQAQAYNAAKRFANNPYLQHAHLVFFVNPDKNPGLAEQVKKLSIPSIGIVSGLKSTAYRKQPQMSNLHDSVTYPIVGNPDNLLFVTMVVRVFVKLIMKAHGSKYSQFDLYGAR